MAAETEKYLLSPEPSSCDICKAPFKVKFIDGKTQFGPWANMCPRCFKQHGFKLGLGYGQEYTKQADGRWLKTGG